MPDTRSDPYQVETTLAGLPFGGRLALGRLPGWGFRRFRRRRGLAALFQAGAQGVHDVDDIAAGARGELFDRLPGLLFLQQILRRGFVMVLEFRGIEMSGLLLDDMPGEIEHVLGDLDV